MFAGARYYDASGALIEGTQAWTHPEAVAVDQLFGYTGQEWDEAAKLYNYNARWYDSATGRFLSEDPIAADVNLYRYALNNPVLYVDPSGLYTALPTDYLPALSRTPQSRIPTADESLRQLTAPKPYDYYHDLVFQTQLDQPPASAVTRTVYVAGQNFGEAARAPWYGSGDAFLAARSGTNDILSPLYYLDAAYTARAALDYSIGNILGGVQDIVTPPTKPSKIDYHANGSYTFHDDEGPPTIVYANQAALLAPAMFGGASRAAGQLTVGSAERIAQSNSLSILNREFTPNGTRVLQNLTNQVNAEFIANPRLATTVLSDAELRATIVSGVARLQYGNAIERLVAERIANDPVGLGSIFEYNIGGRGPDFFGRGHLQGEIYDITTPGQVPAHLARPYGQGLNTILYQRPAGFP